ncbi:hypothetical protein B0H11DRAFT_1939549 [Mycena galericulata]|nr:hypothetical protein B0H11DRAFT_1939549 [Mycena galericulata]
MQLDPIPTRIREIQGARVMLLVIGRHLMVMWETKPDSLCTSSGISHSAEYMTEGKKWVLRQCQDVGLEFEPAALVAVGAEKGIQAPAKFLERSGAFTEIGQPRRERKPLPPEDEEDDATRSDDHADTATCAALRGAIFIFFSLKNVYALDTQDTQALNGMDDPTSTDSIYYRYSDLLAREWSLRGIPERWRRRASERETAALHQCRAVRGINVEEDKSGWGVCRGIGRPGQLRLCGQAAGKFELEGKERKHGRTRTQRPLHRPERHPHHVDRTG